jgi:hypothetical protein
MRKLLEDIAFRVLRIRTLDTQMKDSKDFHEVSVWDLREALEEAYNAGRKSRG